MDDKNLPIYRTTSTVLLAGAVIISSFLVVPGQAHAEEDAKAILKSMTEYVGSQRTFSATVDTAIEVITTDLQKLQFISSGQVIVSRPDKIRLSRVGGYADVELVFDGKTLSLNEKHNDLFAQLDAPGTIEQLVDRLRDTLQVDLPGADLLLPKSYDILMDGVIDAKHIGQGVINGVECEHLAFRSDETDWQIWIEIGPRPIPRQYVITSKVVAGAPQYTLRVKDWQSDAQIAADTFTFKQAGNARKGELKELTSFDEVPAGVVMGEKK